MQHKKQFYNHKYDTYKHANASTGNNNFYGGQKKRTYNTPYTPMAETPYEREQ